MRAEVSKLSSKKGYTLLEILIILVIIGITTGVALLYFDDFGTSRRVIVNAENFVSYLKLVEQQALIEMVPFGIFLSSHSYQTFRFKQGIAWKPLPENSAFHTRYFADNFIINLSKAKNKANPDIVISPSGEITPFRLAFGTSKNPQIADLKVSLKGKLTLFLNS